MVKLGQGGVQVLWWFATVCTLVDEAMEVATSQVDRDVIAKAVEFVRTLGDVL